MREMKPQSFPIGTVAIILVLLCRLHAAIVATVTTNVGFRQYLKYITNNYSSKAIRTIRIRSAWRQKMLVYVRLCRPYSPLSKGICGGLRNTVILGVNPKAKGLVLV